MLIPNRRDVEILQYLFNEHHGTEEAAEKFGMKSHLIPMIIHMNALWMANLVRSRDIEHAKNICVHEYGLSRECIESLIRQVSEDHSESVE